MMKQYGAQRFQRSLPAIPQVIGKGKRQQTVWRDDPRDMDAKYRVGTIRVGQVFYIQDDHRPIGGGCTALRYRWRDCCRNPWQVIAWSNREYYPAVKGASPVTYMRGGHLATVRSLRDGRVKQVADWILLQCEELGLEKV